MNQYARQCRDKSTMSLPSSTATFEKRESILSRVFNRCIECVDRYSNWSIARREIFLVLPVKRNECPIYSFEWANSDIWNNSESV